MSEVLTHTVLKLKARFHFNKIYTKVRNSLTVDYISDFKTINLWGKESVDWDLTPFVKS